MFPTVTLKGPLHKGSGPHIIVINNYCSVVHFNFACIIEFLLFASFTQIFYANAAKHKRQLLTGICMYSKVSFIKSSFIIHRFYDRIHSNVNPVTVFISDFLIHCYFQVS